MNISDYKITITDFTGMPIPIDWTNKTEGSPEEIETNKSYYAYLEGIFPEKMYEKITVTYLVNEVEKTDDSLCTGPTKT